MEKAGVEKGGRHLASQRWQDFPWALRNEEKSREQAAETQGRAAPRAHLEGVAGLSWCGKHIAEDSGWRNRKAAWTSTVGVLQRLHGERGNGVHAGAPRELRVLSWEQWRDAWGERSTIS